MGEWGGGGSGGTGGGRRLSLLGRLRHGVKRGLEIAIVRSGIADRRVRDPKRRRLILAYHNVVADDDTPWGERALHLKRSLFEGHIELLQEKGRIVPLRELLEDVDRGSGDGPRFALTFDDAYQGAIEAIQSILVPSEIPCAVFVNPGLIGTEAFWWDRVAEAFGGVMPSEVRRECLEELRGEAARIEEMLEGGDSVPGPPPSRRFLPPTQEHLERLRALDPLVKLGSHTWSHPNLAALSPGEVSIEIRRCRTWLENFGASEAGVLAYPYGLATAHVLEGAGDSGCAYGLLVEGGHVTDMSTAVSPFAIPRLAIPAGLSGEGLMLRVGGVR